MRRARRLAAGAALAAIVLAASSSRAGEAEEEEARAAMRRGVAEFGRGEADKALAEYEAAIRLAPGANAPHLYAAEALLALGRFKEAVDHLEQYIAKRPDVSDAGEVRERIARIKAEHYPGRVRVTSNVDDAELFVDGEARGSARALELAPGKHRIELRATRREAASQEIVVVGDRDASVFLALAEERPSAPPAAAVGPVAPVVPPERDARVAPSPWPTVGWVTAGVGAATLATFFVVDVAALGPAVSDYHAAADRADPDARTLRDDATSLRTLTVVGYVTGGVLAAAGVGVLLFAPRSTAASPAARSATPTTARLTPWVTPGAAGLGVGGAL